MTLAERILVRWLTAINAGVSAVAAIIVAVEELDSTLILIILVVSAFLSATVSTLTTNTGQTMLGTRDK